MNKFLTSLLLVFTCISCSAEIIEDNFAKETIKFIPKPIVNTNYNYENTDRLPIRLVIIKRIKSEQDIYEGQPVKFQVKKTVTYKNNIIVKRGTIVNARVGTIVSSGMNGIPASIVFDNFQIPNINPSQLTDSYEIFGQDRSLIVFPLKWALTILPPTGSLTNFIKGGHAKLKTDKEIILYYHPQWN